jgi:7,8-dihydropterin-6-yl-methyl-4-(beta-D-ribofuranosyl)aminobenzene 5'-phosphate synthase
MRLLILLLVSLGLGAQTVVKDVRVRILSTMLTDGAGVGEWGFAALVEADGRRILFDTGARPDTVWKNVQEMKIDLSSITDVIISHNHKDHTGGLLTVRREASKANPKALSRIHAGKGVFWSRPAGNGSESNYLRTIRSDYEGTGGVFVEYDGTKEIFPGVWLTGPVRRVHPEKNYGSGGILVRPDGSRSPDDVPEDSSLVLNTPQGLVVVAGCGHAGIINTLEQARREIRSAPIHAAIGGWHLFGATDTHLEWTAGKMKELGVRNFVGAHCTGVEAVYRIRQLTGLSRRTCVVGAVGSGFTLKDGIQPGMIAQ